MVLRIRTRRLVGWLAIGALLLALIAPALARIGARPAIWHEVCTSAGFVRIDAAQGARQDMPAHPVLSRGEHCPWCPGGAAAAAPPPPAPRIPFDHGPGVALDAPTPRAPAAVPTRTVAQPRAPPVAG